MNKPGQATIELLDLASGTTKEILTAKDMIPQIRFGKYTKRIEIFR